MFKANLLYSGEEYIYKKQKIIDDNVFEDLKITKIFEFCALLNFDNVSSKDIKHTMDILKNPCQIKNDILFRQQIFKKFLSSGSFVNDLYDALKEVKAKPIVDHRFLAKNVVKVTYEGGTSFVLNYNNFEEVTFDGQTIAPLSFIKIKN